MARDDIQARRDYHHSEAGRARAQAQDWLRRAEDHEVKVRAYDLVLQDLPLSSPPVESGNDGERLAGDLATHEGSTFIDLVRQAVKPQPDHFELSQVRETMERIAPGLLEGMSDRKALSKTLSRMADMKEIYIERKGQGKRPALYSKALTIVPFHDFATAADDDRPEEEVNDKSSQVSDRVPTSG